MTDYNDGSWHGWNGGECPVHPDSLVGVKMRDGGEYVGQKARFWMWGEDSGGTIIAFRVTNPYVEPKEPREFWVQQMTEFNLDGNVTGYRYQECNEKQGQFKVREVLE